MNAAALQASWNASAVLSLEPLISVRLQVC